MKISKSVDVIEETQTVVVKKEVPKYTVEMSQDDLDYIVLIIGKVGGRVSDVYNVLDRHASELKFEKSPSKATSRGVYQSRPTTEFCGIWVERLPERSK